VLQLLSHDMRSPQASIITMVEGPQGVDLPRDMASRIARHARRTMSLADGFVQLARAQAAPFEPVEIMLADTLIEAADDLLPLAREKGLTIALEGTEEPVFLMAEPQMLLRAFTNLIDNAIKYSPAGTTITCAISPAPVWTRPKSRSAIRVKAWPNMCGATCSAASSRAAARETQRRTGSGLCENRDGPPQRRHRLRQRAAGHLLHHAFHNVTRRTSAAG
jgi:nitrogen fixation/metabolism regulation signal transduction histidine kinase